MIFTAEQCTFNEYNFGFGFTGETINVSTHTKRDRDIAPFQDTYRFMYFTRIASFAAYVSFLVV